MRKIKLWIETGYAGANYEDVIEVEAIYTAYPEITDSCLLELARLGFNQGFVIYSKDLEEFKQKLLKLLIYNKTDEIYHAVCKIMGG